MNRSINIIVTEPSPIVCEGLKSVLTGTKTNFSLSFSCTLEDLEPLIIRRKCELIILNPSCIINNEKTFDKLRNKLPGIRWIAIIYGFFDPKVISKFDGTISLTDDPNEIINRIAGLLSENNIKGTTFSKDVLSERESGVLKLLASGLPNKEIADRLNISINTVITHRKNISLKTGIKSVSGLTIYAVAQKLVSIDTVPH